MLRCPKCRRPLDKPACAFKPHPGRAHYIPARDVRRYINLLRAVLRLAPLTRAGYS